MTVDQAIHIVQVAFPQIYLACHTRHQRKRSTEHQLSQRDASISPRDLTLVAGGMERLAIACREIGKGSQGSQGSQPRRSA